VETQGLEMTPAACIQHKECVSTKFYEKNTAILSSYITPGDYYLKFFINDPQLAFLQAKVKFLPFTIQLKLNPLYERLDRYNCNAGRLPGTLNSPGLMDNGTLHFAGEVVLDIYAGS
jgi:hypothetical protein